MPFLSVPWTYVFPSFGGSTAETRPVKVEMRARVVRSDEVNDLVAKSRAMVVCQAGLYKFRRCRVSFSFMCKVCRIVVYEAVNHKVRELS